MGSKKRRERKSLAGALGQRSWLARRANGVNGLRVDALNIPARDVIKPLLALRAGVAEGKP